MKQPDSDQCKALSMQFMLIFRMKYYDFQYEMIQFWTQDNKLSYLISGAALIGIYLN